MEQGLWLLPLGFVVGACGTLIGAGGGFLLVPVLLLLYPRTDAQVITAISLTVVLFNALSGSFAYARMRRIDYRSGLLFASVAIPGAALGALTTALIPRRVFDPIFGGLLVVLSIFLFLRPLRGRKTLEHAANGQPTRHVLDSDGNRHAFSYDVRLGVGLSLVVGYFSSLFGIGGGIIHVPAMVHLLNFPTHVATATSHFILVLTSFTGAMVHSVRGKLDGVVQVTTWLAVGALFGAQLGAQLSRRIHAVWILRALAVGLGLVGARILLVLTR